MQAVVCVQVFGLHANADISYYTSAAKELWSNLVDLQPRVGTAAGNISREEFIAGAARDVAAKIPEQFDLVLLAKGLGVPTPTQVVLLQELARWNGVLEAMTGSLKDLHRALSGEVGFNAFLEELAASLYNGKVPPAWARLNPATEKPLGPWMAWFTRRHEQYKAWAEEGEPRVMWLAGLHAPETYLAALVQAACRDRGWPLDKSALYTQVTRFIDPAQVQEKPLSSRWRRAGCSLLVHSGLQFTSHKHGAMQWVLGLSLKQTWQQPCTPVTGCCRAQHWCSTLTGDNGVEHSGIMPSSRTVAHQRCLAALLATMYLKSVFCVLQLHPVAVYIACFHVHALSYPL
eukprot:GHRR01033451.1.p1 GENE.GHRR01033451.1~~GHRR01033451.1.p1  ORF type:complete len:345 (+),score=87.92 GHRR01033451.1:1018-2052(+)